MFFFNNRLLFYAGLALPFKTAFIDDQTNGERFLDLGIDILFLIDIIINFFSAYYDNEENLITDKKVIAKNYLKGWFFIDLVTSIPLDFIIDSQAANINSIVKVSRLPRLYKIFKMTKLMRVLKVIKDRNKFLTYFNDIFKLNSGLERYILSLIFILLFCHFTACVWFLINQMENEFNSWMNVNRLSEASVIDVKENFILEIYYFPLFYHSNICYCWVWRSTT